MPSDRQKSVFIKFIAYLQVIGIVLVVFHHSFHEYPDGEWGQSLLIVRSLMSFRMPLFMFVSGFLMAYTTKVLAEPRIDIKQFVINKIKRLLLPMVALSSAAYFPRVYLSDLADDRMVASMRGFIDALTLSDKLPIPFFWFLQASFILLCVNFIILFIAFHLRVPNKVTLFFLWITFLILAILPIEAPTFFSLDNVIRLGVYFVLGIIYCAGMPEVDRYVPWESFWFLTTMVMLWFLSFVLFENTEFQIITSVTGIAMCVSAAKILEKRKCHVLDHLVGANYMIFLLSWFFNVASQQILSHYVDLPWWIYSLLSFVCGIYIPWLGYRYIQRHPESRWVRVTAFLLGQTLKTTSKKWV